MENNNMMMDMNMDMKKNRPHCPVIDINGLISNGKQFDLDITLPEDTRDVLFGTVKNVFREPVKNAVVKLIEIDCGKDGRKRRLPISHTFTDKYGEFIFGPLCAGKQYAIDIWVNEVRKYDIDVKICHKGECLKATPGEKCESHDKPDCKC